MAAKIRRVERKKTALRNVTVRLFGWPAETRMLSVVEACWMVELQFQAPAGGTIMSLTYFESQDYEVALAKYNMLLKIAEEKVSVEAG